MKISKKKLNIELARCCKRMSDLRGEGLSPQTLVRINRGENVKPVTVGKIAKALGVDPIEIMEED